MYQMDAFEGGSCKCGIRLEFYTPDRISHIVEMWHKAKSTDLTLFDMHLKYNCLDFSFTAGI